MSLPLPGPLAAFNVFKMPLSITHVNYTTTASGRDVPAITGTEEIQAAVDASGSKRLEQIFGGSMTDGDIGIYTNVSDLNVVDESVPGTLPQDYATYSGSLYRLVAKADWNVQAQVFVYLGRRHTDPLEVGA